MKLQPNPKVPPSRANFNHPRSPPLSSACPGITVAMDSTTDRVPVPVPTPTPAPALSASKLPIKRKTPDPNPSPGPNVDPVSFPPITAFKSHPEPESHSLHTAVSRLPPFKFHRIWTESDELRFLQGLLHCRSENFSFPRDLNVFYSRFSNTMSQPYTKSQLSDKLRRLRKKYRVISTRLSQGLDQAFLTTHDRALHQLSTRLWHPDYAKTSPFGGGCGCSCSRLQKSDLVSGVQVNFSSTLSDPYLVETLVSQEDGYAEVGLGGEERLSEGNVEFEEEGAREPKLPRQTGVENSTDQGALVAKAIVDAFDESLKEVIKGVVNEEQHGCVTEGVSTWSFQGRWQEQRLAEMEALGRRMRLIFEYSLL